MKYLPLLLLLIACTEVVTDSNDPCQTVTADAEGDGTVEPCAPGCSEDLTCDDATGLCQDKSAPAPCGWYRPGPDAGAEMCRIQATSFTMGCDDDATNPSCPTDSQPEVTVLLTQDYFVDRYEVTNLRYKAFLVEKQTVPIPDCDDGDPIWDDADKSDPKFADDMRHHPVVCVNAIEAQGFCAWAGKELPTEARWELAARGPNGRIWPWGYTWATGNAQCEHDWENYNPLFQCKNTFPSDTCPEPVTTDCTETAPVMNDEGQPILLVDNLAYPLQHMAGNVAEWVRDDWNANHNGCKTDGMEGCTEPFTPPEAGGWRPVRGGSWDKDDWDDITGWSREPVKEDERYRNIGFRCVWSPAQD